MRKFIRSIRAFTGLLLFVMLLSETAFSQASLPVCTKPNGSTYLPHCVSNDLSVAGAFLTANQCFCTAGQSTQATLNFKLLNKTGSTRTSFAFFAILVQKDANGNVVSSSYLTRCTGPVSPASTSTIAFGDPITFICGSSLTLTNVYLAWTDASDHKTCPLDFCDISPKCGQPADIVITPLLTAKATTVASCDNVSTGSITVTPSGGTSPYDIVIKLGSTTVATYTNVTAPQTKTGLAAGTYTISVTDAADPACTYTFTAVVGSKACCVAPPKPVVCETPASLCGDGKASLTISNAVVGDTYYLTQGSTTTSKVAASSTLTFTGLTPGAGFSVYGEDVKNGTTCKGAAATCADLTGTCSAQAAVVSNNSSIQTQEVKLESPKTNVIAAPNPFNDRIRFSLQSEVSGRGSLDLYNMLGQKVNTVFQGYVQKGIPKTVEYSVPGPLRSTLIYVFRVGEQKVTGKLLNLK